MITLTRINLLRPIKRFIQQLRSSSQESADLSCLSKNPWQEDLARMAAERRLREADPEQQDEITHFVNNLAKSSQEIEPVQTAESKNFNGKHKREQDKTITDLKSWWKESVGTFDEKQSNKVHIDVPEERRMMKRWFH